MIDNLIEYFSKLSDPRCPGKVEHRLIDILVIAICAVIACAESWEDIALYGRSKLPWLRQFLSLPNEIPLGLRPAARALVLCRFAAVAIATAHLHEDRIPACS